MELARLEGIIRWVCPRCGQRVKSRLTRSHSVRCSAPGCQYRYAVGLVFYQARHRHAPTPAIDTLVESDRWKHGQTVNKAVCAVCSEIIATAEPEPVESKQIDKPRQIDTRSNLPMLLPRKRRQAKDQEFSTPDQMPEGTEE